VRRYMRRECVILTAAAFQAEGRIWRGVNAKSPRARPLAPMVKARGFRMTPLLIGRFTLRPESSHSLPGSASAEMSAARKVKYLKELFIVVRDCTYICVHGSVPVGTLLQTADVFLREHFRQGAAPYAWASGQRGRLSPQERCRTRADECVRRSTSRFHPRRPGRLSPHRFTRRLR